MSENETTTNTPDSDDSILAGHTYDGIEEYDNPMPGWWVWLFIASIIWSPIYYLGVHQFDFINSYEDDLAEKQAELVALRDAHEAANPSVVVSEESIAAYIGVQAHIESGAALFSTSCAMCHANNAGGLIGPNLTDNYWLHGGSNTDIFTVITEGVLDKGMTPWGSVLSEEQRFQLVAFIRSVEGSNPEGAKAPEGEMVAPTPTSASESE